MKITTPGEFSRQTAASVNKTNSKANANLSETADPEASSETLGRDFATVLEEISSTPQEERPAEDVKKKEPSETKEKSLRRAGSEFETKENVDKSGGKTAAGDVDGESGAGEETGRGVGLNPHTSTLRETSWRGEVTNARAVLHIADLEKLVSTVRTQILANGQPEVTLDLQRSVLEGLRVKLSTDSNGRINAEFIASSERVRAQVESRTSELADLMRSRGIDLAALRTSVGGGDASRSSTGDQRQQGSAFDFSRAGKGRIQNSSSPASTSSLTSADTTDEIDDTGSTYRA